jgi:hypothetical protein
MSFDRRLLPEPTEYFESRGLVFREPRSAKWRTTGCEFHGGSDSMRVNTQTGSFRCMACAVSGGDVLSYEMQLTGGEFVDAAKSLGAWVDDGRPHRPQKPTTLPPRAALEVLGFEATVVAVAAGNIAKGVELTESDRQRLLLCANRIARVVEDFT